jgi:hypothetical protein
LLTISVRKKILSEEQASTKSPTGFAERGLEVGVV